MSEETKWKNLKAKESNGNFIKKAALLYCYWWVMSGKNRTSELKCMHDSQRKTFRSMFEWAMNILVIVLKFIYWVIWMCAVLLWAWPWAVFEWISKTIRFDSFTSISIHEMGNSKIPCRWFQRNYLLIWLSWAFLNSIGPHVKRKQTSVSTQKIEMNRWSFKLFFYKMNRKYK